MLDSGWREPTRAPAGARRVRYLSVALRRVFVDRIEGREAAVRGRSAHHLARVARLRPGENVEISDQKTAYRALTTECSKTEVRFKVQEPLPPPRPVRVEIALAIIKFSRFEWAVEKLSEIGVRTLTPLIAGRCDKRLVRASGNRRQRWARIAFEAAQQSRQLAAPSVLEPRGLEAVVRDCKAENKVLADPQGDPAGRICGMGSATLLVGPEGGWTASETALAVENGFRPAGLGTSVLRSETAAVSLAAVIRSRQDLGASE